MHLPWKKIGLIKKYDFNMGEGVVFQDFIWLTYYVPSMGTFNFFNPTPTPPAAARPFVTKKSHGNIPGTKRNDIKKQSNKKIIIHKRITHR